MSVFANMPDPPGVLRSWIELYEPLTEAPAQAHLGAAIALISAAIGWKASVKWGEHEEPCTVNVVLEGRSATARKTTVAGSAHRIARDAMKTIHEDARQLRTRSISHTSSRGLVEAVAPKDKTEAERWEDQPPPGVLLVWDEFGAVLGDPRDIKGAGWLGQIRAMLMQFTSGRHGGIQTGAEKLPPARCAVSVLATMTRIELEQRVSYGLLRDGFMGRFLLIPFEGRPRLLATPPAWTGAMMQQRNELVEWLRGLASADVQLGDVFTKMTPDALDVRHDWYRDTVTRLEQQAEDEAEGSLAAVEAFGRLQTAALKVATVAAVSEWQPGQSELSSVRIDQKHVEYGQALTDICLNEIIELGRLAGHPLRDVYADKIRQYLEKHGPTSKKIILDGVRLQGLARGDRWRVVEELHPDTVEISRRDSGGRPSLIVALTSEEPGERPRNPSADTYADGLQQRENGSTMRKTDPQDPYAAYADGGLPPSILFHTPSRERDEAENLSAERVSESSISLEQAKNGATYAADTRTNRGGYADNSNAELSLATEDELEDDIFG